MPPPATWTDVELEITVYELNFFTILVLTNDDELPESMSIDRGVPSNVPLNWIVFGARTPLTIVFDRARKICSV
jgi:hypothetical protein